MTRNGEAMEARILATPRRVEELPHSMRQSTADIIPGILAELRAAPGQWFCIAENQSSASNLVKHLKPYNVEVVGRMNGQRRMSSKDPSVTTPLMDVFARVAQPARARR